MGKILITASHYETLCREAKEMLEKEGHEVVLNKSDMPYYSFEDLKPLVGDIDGAIIGMDQWNEKVFACAPKLKVIARFGVGIDNIDIEAAKRRGIVVTNALGQNANAVAELAVGYMLSILRGLTPLTNALKGGEWQRFVGHDIKGKTIGLLGFGDISRRVAKKLMGFDARVIACDLYPRLDEAKKLNVEIVPEDELLKTSDIVSIHIPSTKATCHYMDKNKFSVMKKGAYFINTARGALVDENALCDAVEAKQIAGACLDVYEKEPLDASSRLLRYSEIITTPHTGAETYETYTQVSLCTAEAVIDVLSGREPKNWVNK